MDRGHVIVGAAGGATRGKNRRIHSRHYGDQVHILTCQCSPGTGAIKGAVVGAMLGDAKKGAQVGAAAGATGGPLGGLGARRRARMAARAGY
jgi:hypothetical protein